MDDKQIDWEALAKAAYDESNEQYLLQTGDEWGTTWEESGDDLQAMKTAEARAVVAALAEQRLVVLPAEDLSGLCGLAEGYAYLDDDKALVARCAALVAADGAGKEQWFPEFTFCSRCNRDVAWVPETETSVRCPVCGGGIGLMEGDDGDDDDAHDDDIAWKETSG